MKYVYRDPERLRGRPVHVPEEAEIQPPAEPEPQPEAAPAPACRGLKQPAKQRPRKQQDPKPAPRPLPPPMWGGRAGLMLAAKESEALDQRTNELIAAGHDSPWIREVKRIRKTKQDQE